MAAAPAGQAAAPSRVSSNSAPTRISRPAAGPPGQGVWGRFQYDCGLGPYSSQPESARRGPSASHIRGGRDGGVPELPQLPLAETRICGPSAGHRAAQDCPRHCRKY